jgi:hypothetical protein
LRINFTKSCGCWLIQTVCLRRACSIATPSSLFAITQSYGSTLPRQALLESKKDGYADNGA